MPIEFRCDQCDKLLRTADDKAGLSAQCPGCGVSLIVPHQEPAFTDELEIGEAQPERRPKKCPMCGSTVQRGADRCRNCGELLDVDDDNWYVPSDPRQVKDHRGVVLLVCAIFSWVCLGFLLAIPVWIMANQDLASMKEGTMDAEGEGLTQAARIISICNVALTVISLLLVFCMIGLAAVGGR